MIPADLPGPATTKTSATKTTTPTPLNESSVKEARARETSIKLEATFLSEMLKSAGFGLQKNSFSGSAGEDQFASFQRQAIAENMARAGGIGLSEHFFNAIMEAQKND